MVWSSAPHHTDNSRAPDDGHSGARNVLSSQ